MPGLFRKFRISHRLYAGFALLILLLAGAVGATLWQVGSIGVMSDRISNLRVPTALASEELSGGLTAASAGLQGFLLTGSEKTRAEFDAAWKQLDEVSVTFDKLAASFTNPENVKRWADFKVLRDELRLAQQKVLAIADLANQRPAIELNSTEAAPRMAKLMAIMIGDLQADGSRTGGMLDNQKKLLNGDAGAIASAISALVIIEWLLLGIGIALGVGTAFLTARAVAVPLVGMTGAMGKLAEGNLETVVPGMQRSDEIGEMAAAVQVFKENALKVREMNDAEAIRTGQTRERAASMTKLTDGLAGAVNAAIDGDFTQRIALSFPDEDLKAVAKNVNHLLSTVDAGISETSQVLAALAQTDLTQRMRGEYRGAFAKLKADINAVVDNLSDVVGQLRQTSGGLKTATGEILAGANDLAERTTKQAAAIEETSAAMEQLSATVVENAKRAELASRKAQNVSDTAALTGEVMAKSNHAMERISTSSAKISNIIGLIDDIAFQTNLLALNASVEAARAGDAGKGFAVVAVEVRRLAQSAASASSEVKVLIEQSAGEVSSGSKLVAEATQKLVDMLGSVKESAELIKDISSATREQSNAIAEVSIAIRQMDEMTQHNAALVEETNAAIEQTEGQANELDSIVDRFVVDQRATSAAAPVQAARSVSAAPATGIMALQQKVKAAANSYLAKGNTALKEKWSEF